MEKISIDEIIIQYRLGSKEAEELLFSWAENNIGLIWESYQQNAPQYMSRVEDAKMFIAEVTFRIVENYDMDKSSFTGFWKLCVRREISHLINEKYFDFSVTFKEDDMPTDLLNDELDIYENKDFINRLAAKTKKCFGQMGFDVTFLLLDGWNRKEIVDKLQISSYQYRRVSNFLKDEIVNYLSKN